MSEHTKEPWFTVETECDVIEITNADRDGVIVPIAEVSTGYVKQVGIEQEANARRIVACVNACDGITTAALEYRVHLLKAEDDQIAELTQQRDKLLAALNLIEVDKDGDGFICREAMKQVRETIADTEGVGA